MPPQARTFACSGNFALQASLTLSNSAPSPAAQAAAPVREASLQQMQEQVQAMRNLVQSQQIEIQALQALAQEQPLQGFTTDSPWGMAIEGALLGLVALGLGLASMWGYRPVRAGAVRAPLFTPLRRTKPEFADSMLYLADQEVGQSDSVAVAAQLHDPQEDARAATLAHDEGDAELDYYRMALSQQGLSVTAGAGKVDSDRVPLDMQHTSATASSSHRSINVFGPSPNPAEFDQRAAAEEVERVRRYLAQRRADRAQAQAAPSVAVLHAPASGVPTPATAAVEVDIAFDLEPPAPVSEAGVQWEDLVASSNPQAPMQLVAPASVPELPLAETGLDALEHADFSEGASVLAAFSDSELEPYATAPEAPAAAGLPTAAAKTDTQAGLLEWDMATLSPAIEVTPESATPVCDAAEDHVPPFDLPSDHIQMELAIQFRDLGLWSEARERVLEVLEQPDTGLHPQARDLLAELAKMAPAPLEKKGLQDPWG